MLQRLINLHFSCHKCPNKWKTEDGLVKLYYNPKWVAENNLWLFLFKTVVVDMNCPKCNAGYPARSVSMIDVESVAAEFGLDIIRKISEKLNEVLTEDSSKDSSIYSDLNYLANSKVLDPVKLQNVKD